MTDPLGTENINKLICDRAAQIANNDSRKPHQLRHAPHLFFERASKDKLSIDFDDGLLPHTEPERSDIKRLLCRIGKEAIAKSIKQNADLWIGAVIGEAREGKNYFRKWQG